jgi:hypothetical protein
MNHSIRRGLQHQPARRGHGAPATDGAPILHLAPRPARPRQAFVVQEIALLKSQIHDTVQAVVAPGLGDRLMQLLYH